MDRNQKFRIIVEILEKEDSETASVFGSFARGEEADKSDIDIISAKKYDASPYFYDGSLLLAEKVGSQITKIYINDGTGIIGMVRPIYDGSNSLTHYQRLYYLYDSLGSVSAITGEHGLPLQNYTYSPFGTCLNVTGDPINNLQFVGRYGGYLDNDTGLTYFWHRWYDSKDGRWISRDPIGINGGMNLYGYVKNRPINKIDFNGYKECGCPSGMIEDVRTTINVFGLTGCILGELNQSIPECFECATSIATAVAMFSKTGTWPMEISLATCGPCGVDVVTSVPNCAKQNCSTRRRCVSPQEYMYGGKW